MIRTILIGTAMGAAAIALCAPVSADQYDFVNQVDSAGIGYPDGSISQMIDIGKAVCHDVRIGTAPDLVVAKLGNVGYSGYEGGVIMGAAANGMCPDTWPILQSWSQRQHSPTPSEPSPCVLEDPPPGCADGSY